MKIPNLPPCGHCGSKKVVSRGASIVCDDCGRSSIKIRRSHTTPMDERPWCPECGAGNPYSLGVKKWAGKPVWQCKNCGRAYTGDTIDRLYNLSSLNMEVQKV